MLLRCVFLVSFLLSHQALSQDGRVLEYDFYLAGAEDTFIDQGTASSSSGDGTVVSVRFSSSSAQWGLLRYRFDSLSEVATRPVVEAAIRVNINHQGGNGLVDTSGRTLGLSFHRMLKEWDETSTWNSLNLEEGVDYVATPITTAEILGGATGKHEITGFAAAAQAWADGSWENYGILVKPYVPDGSSYYPLVTFRSVEYLKAYDRFPQMRVRLKGTTSRQVQGADVREHLADATLYVSPTGDDGADGSSATPLASINTALSIAATRQSQFLGTRIVVAAGVYRETLDALQTHDTPPGCYDPIILEAAPGAEVVITGAEAWSSWQATGAADIYSAAWPYDWGNVVPIPAGGTAYEQEWVEEHPLLRRREMVVVEGDIYRQVIDSSELQSLPGSFYVDEGGDTLSVHFSAGHGPSSSVEVSERAFTMVARDTDHLVLRGLTFQHAGSVLLDRGGVLLERCSELLIEGCRFNDNNGNGLSIYGTDDTIDGFPIIYPCRHITLRDTQWNNNGIGGIETYANENVLIENCESCQNNWRGNREGFRFGWVTSRLYRCHNAIIRQLKANQNECRGWWFDYDNRDILVDNSQFNHNLTNGVKFEVNEGPITFTQCQFNDNGEPGITSTNGGGVVFEECEFHRNGKTQIEVLPLEAHFIRDWETGISSVQESIDWTVTGNSFETGLGQSFWIVPTSDHPFIGSLVADRNLYAASYDLEGFQISADAESMALGQWQSSTVQDSGSQIFRLYSTGDAEDDTEVFLPISQDTTLREEVPDTAEGTGVVLTQTIYGAARYTFLQFDLSALASFDSAASIISGAEIQLEINDMHHSGDRDVAGLSHRIQVHRVYQPWSESSTWNSADSVTTGRVYDPTPLTSIDVVGSEGTGKKVISGLETAVKKWLSGEWENAGVVLVSTATDAPFNYLSIRSRETTNIDDRPTLRVTTRDQQERWSFYSWAREHFSARDITAPQEAIYTADHDSDTVSNFDEYAVGSNPNVVDAIGSTLDLLITEDSVDLAFRVKDGNIDHVSPHVFQIDDVQYRIATSLDLEVWHQQSVLWQPQGTSTREGELWFTAKHDRSNFPDKRFYRLEYGRVEE